MSEAQKEQFVEVAPLAFAGNKQAGYTYSAPTSAVVGQLVQVPFGRRNVLGIVTTTGVTEPDFATKPLAAMLPLKPLPSHLIGLAKWIGAYYAANPKAVWQSMLPAGLESRRRAARKAEPEPFELPKQEQELTDDQAGVVRAVNEGSGNFLLQGVTGSGKTRIYLELAATQLAAGRSVIVLVPEISLTPQLMAHFEASFKGRVIAYHSGLTPRQRHLAWQQALEATEPVVVVGPRSSLFLPVESLGLIVIDECHESAYKQEQAPRYSALTVAAKLAALAGAKLVLGSATPGLTEVYLAEQGRLQLIKLPERIGGRPLPPAQLIDLKADDQKSGRRKSALISEPLLSALTETLAGKRQSLLFLNRRGSASSQICNHCGHVAMCPTCELPLTFHADIMKLVCHICNYRVTPAAVCSNCQSTDLKYVGVGTKRIEQEVSRLLPDAKIERLDKDSLDHGSLPDLHRRLHAGEIDILIGTQMIAKGLDLPLLDTVGVINADTMLYMPDYSAAERTFQLLTQVAGRAGRADREGRVFFQTHTPDHPAIVAAAKHDFWGFAEAELAARKLMGYPPYRYLLKLTVSKKDSKQGEEAAEKLQRQLQRRPDIKVLGPAPAFHQRAGGQWHWQLIIKAARRVALLEIASNLPADWKSDLDPLNLL